MSRVGTAYYLNMCFFQQDVLTEGDETPFEHLRDYCRLDARICKLDLDLYYCSFGAIQLNQSGSTEMIGLDSYSTPKLH